jgi:hypothetical protein
MNLIDNTQVAVSPNGVWSPSPLPRHRQGERFLRGPIPWDWIAAASRLPGKALHVAVALWHLAGIKDSARVQLSPSVLRDIGIQRHAGYRGLRRLESAGLVEVARHRGRSPTVTLRECPPTARPNPSA